MEKRNKNGLTEKEFLEQYNPGDYERPSVTVDMMVLRMRDDLECLQILLIQRGDHPYIGCWALPGGFVGIDESTYTAACRELEEETGLKNVYLEQVYTMSQPNRDPRMRIIDVAYLALLPYESDSNATAGDDASDALWFDISFKDKELVLINIERNIEIKYSLEESVFQNGRIQIKNYVPVISGEEKLAFDHADILLEGLSRIRNKVTYTDIAFNLVPEEFTLPDLQKVYEKILGKELYKANFRDKIETKVERVGKDGRPITSKKLAWLYRYKEIK